MDWTEFVAHVDRSAIPRAAILKPYVGPREPGIVYIGFEVEWMRLLCHARLREFAERYTLIVAPSSSPYNLINFIFPAAYPTSLYSLVNHDEDVAILQRISPKYRVVPMYTSHWVNPARYQPRPRAERDIDILMVAAWGKVKRHRLLSRALRRMPASLKVVVIGQDQDGRTQATMRKECGAMSPMPRCARPTAGPGSAFCCRCARVRPSWYPSRWLPTRRRPFCIMPTTARVGSSTSRRADS